jgi:hypothetical protein
MTSYTPQNPVGTPSHQRMQNPATQQNPNVGQIPIGGQPPLSGQIPTRGQSSFNTQISTGGKPPFTCQIPISTQSMAGGQFQPSFTGNPPQSQGPLEGGLFHKPHKGGTSNPNLQGGILNSNPYGLHSGQPFPGVLNPTWGPQGQPSFPLQGKIP